MHQGGILRLQKRHNSSSCAYTTQRMLLCQIDCRSRTIYYICIGEWSDFIKSNHGVMTRLMRKIATLLDGQRPPR